MSGETKGDVSGLTVDTLKLLMDERDRRYEQRFVASSVAVEKATAALESRLEGMNEIRGAMIEQTAKFIPRAESEAVTTALAKEIADLRDRLNLSAGQHDGAQVTRGQMYAGLVIAVMILGLIVTAANLAF